MTKIRLILLQLKMLIYKRFLFTKRNWKTFLFFTVFPILVSMTFIISTQGSGDGTNSHPLSDNKIEISDDLYPYTNVIYADYKENDSKILQNISNLLNISGSHRVENLKTNLEIGNLNLKSLKIEIN